MAIDRLVTWDNCSKWHRFEGSKQKPSKSLHESVSRSKIGVDIIIVSS